MSKTLILKLAGMTRNLTTQEHDVLFNNTFNGIEIRPINQEGSTPMPWDADFHISAGPKGDLFNLLGGVDASGFGECNLALPLKSVDNYYRFEVTINDGKERPVYHVLRSVGIRFQNEGKSGETESEASLTHAYWSMNENDWVRECDGSCLMDLEDASHFLKYEGERLTPADDTEGSIGLQHDHTTGSWVIVRTTIVL